MTVNEPWVRVADEAAFDNEPMQTLDLGGGEAVLVCRIAGRYYAVEDRCSHDDGPLGEGELRDGTIVCPRHGARFDPQNGAALTMPAVTPIRTYPVRAEGGAVWVRLEDE